MTMPPQEPTDVVQELEDEVVDLDAARRSGDDEDRDDAADAGPDPESPEPPD